LSLCPERALDEARRLDEKIGAGEPIEPLTGVPVQSKTTLRYANSRRPALQKYWKVTSRLIQPQPWNACAAPERSSLVRRIATNLQWARRPRTPDISSLAIRIISTEFQAAPAADRQPAWLPEHRSLPWVRIPGDR